MAPEDDLGLIHLVPGGIGWFKAGSMAEGAIDVDHPAACSADEMVVVVAGSGFKSGGGSGRLDPTDQVMLDERREPVVDGLVGDGSRSGVDVRLHLVGGAVGLGRDGIEDGHALRGHL